MARIRSINPSAPVDDDVAAMSLAARYVWAYLPCHADREGRLKDSAFTLKAAIMPADEVDMEAVLVELAAQRHILRYAIDGRRFIQVRSFTRHQRPHPRETPSTIPPPSATGLAQGEPKARPGRTMVGPTVHAMSFLPPIPDPDPDPDPGPDHDQRRGREEETAVVPPIGRNAFPTAGTFAPGVWPPYDWYVAFQKAWCAAKGEARYRDRGGQDARAMQKLADVIRDTPSKDVLDAQARAGSMFTMFLGETGRAEENAHPFAFYVARFDEYRVRSKVTRPVRTGWDAYEPPPLPPGGMPPELRAELYARQKPKAGG